MAKDGMMFKVGKSTYKIGSKMFPVNQVSKLKVFIKENTNPIENQKLADEIMKYAFETGRCYTNSDLIKSIGERLGLNIEFYCGWLFCGTEQPPIHHAWAVLDGNVIDVAISTIETEILSKVDTTNPNWRKEVAPILVALKNNKKLGAKDRYTFGKVVNPYIYAGCPDERFNAAETYLKLIDKFPNHPSYKYDGANKTDRSDLQKEIIKHGGI